MMNEQNDQAQSGAAPAGQPATGSSQDTGGEGVKDKARRLASDAQHQVGEQVQSGLDTGKRKAAQALGGVAESLRRSGGDEDQTPMSRYFQNAGERVQRISEYLDKTDMRDLLVDTENFARRQPALFLGSAFALGIFAARFIKSSGRGDDRPSRNDYGYQRPGDDMSFDRQRPVGSFQETAQGMQGDQLGSPGGMNRDMGTSGYGGAGGMGSAGKTPGAPATPGAGGTTGFADANRAGTDALSSGSPTGPLGTTEGTKRP